MIEFFLKEKVKVHIDLEDGTFLNGFFIREVKKGLYILKEDKLGEVYVFVKQIYKLFQYREKGGGE